jgi:folate-dependent phosphoribosylglycinamide formyltransferase PurN
MAGIIFKPEMKKALVLTSTSLRHSYFTSKLSELFNIVGVLNEPKKNYFTESRSKSLLIEDHFKLLSDFENRTFILSNEKIIKVKIVNDVNAVELVEYAKNLSPDVVCLFGTSILKKEWLEAFPNKIVNLHLGLSPFYRGSATLFWPFYFQELECLGTTIHIAIDKVDAGAILRRIKASFKHGDGYYDITTRLIRDSIDIFPHIVNDYLNGSISPIQHEDIAGRLMRKTDFCEKALIKVIDYLGPTGISTEQVNQIIRSKKCPCLQ